MKRAPLVISIHYGTERSLSCPPGHGSENQSTCPPSLPTSLQV